MASAAAVASGFRHYLLRPSSHSFLCSYPLTYNKGLPFVSLHSSSFSPRPQILPFSRPQSKCPLSPIKSRRIFSISNIPHLGNEQDEEFQRAENELDGADNGLVEEEEEEDKKGEVSEVGERVVDLPRYPSPVLSVKEKKELASYAHSLGKKLKSQQVGKSGVTPSLISAFSDALEANELLKLKVHGNCPGELPDVIRLLEASTGSVVVGQIGRSIILYRPSISKMRQAQEKRPIRSPPRPRSFNGPSSQPSGLRDRTRKTFIRRSKPTLAKAQ